MIIFLKDNVLFYLKNKRDFTLKNFRLVGKLHTHYFFSTSLSILFTIYIILKSYQIDLHIPIYIIYSLEVLVFSIIASKNFANILLNREFYKKFILNDVGIINKYFFYLLFSIDFLFNIFIFLLASYKITFMQEFMDIVFGIFFKL